MTTCCITQYEVLYFIKISQQKLNYLKNHFSLLTRGLCGFDSSNKNIPKKLCDTAPLISSKIRIILQSITKINDKSEALNFLRPL